MLATLGQARTPWTPWHDLLAALLFDVFKCAAHPRPVAAPTRYVRRRVRSQVELDRDWADGHGGILSFAYVCEVLNLDPSAVRRQLDAPPELPKGIRLAYKVIRNCGRVIFSGRVMEDGGA